MNSHMNGQRDAEARVRAEAEFHDSRIQGEDEGRRGLGYVYASVADVYAFGSVPADFLDGTVLEIGCFRGDHASALRRFRGRYVGIDISPAAIDHCRELGLPPAFEFRVDDANVLGSMADGEVDFAFGHGVLHHLDLPRFAPALARKLSARGVGRFIEPAQGNVLVRAFRRLTPQLRTPDEYPFDHAAIELLRRHFEVQIGYQALMRPYAPMLFFNSRPVIRASRWVDDRLLRHRFFQDQAWLLQIELRPRRDAVAV
ncbi:class I SAM-dependent methyltransferase [Luteimonas sp. A277]